VEALSPSQTELSALSRLLRWMATMPAKRYREPGLVAYYWTSGKPKACPVGNISSSGMYVVAEEQWLPGSVLPMTLQTDSTSEHDGEEWIAVVTRVVRSGPDGFGLAFVFSRVTSHLFGDAIPAERVADPRALKRFIRRVKV
jgi:hypothetical protein